MAHADLGWRIMIEGPRVVISAPYLIGPRSQQGLTRRLAARGYRFAGVAGQSGAKDASVTIVFEREFSQPQRKVS